MISVKELVRTVGGSRFQKMDADCEDLEVALNYGQAMGCPPLLRFVTEHTEVS